MHSRVTNLTLIRTSREDAQLIRYINEYNKYIYTYYKNDTGRVEDASQT